MRQLRAAAVLGALLVAVMPATASALQLWTLTLTPLTATANESTLFSLTATNEDLLNELGCLQVDLPGSFVIESIGVPSASNGETWYSYRSGNSVITRSLDGGGRLEMLQSVTFTIRAHATQAGAFVWTNHAHRAQDCGDATRIGVPLSVTVLPAVVATPDPTPTPAPTATPSPGPLATPTPLPIPTPSLPPLPSIDLFPTPSPTPASSTAGTPTPTPEPSASSTAGPSGAAMPTPGPTSAGPGGGGSPGNGDGAGGGGATSDPTAPLQVAREVRDPGADTQVGVELLDLLDADYVWFVPAASVGVPGLLVILWVFLQAIGALAWIPALRRMAEEPGAPRTTPGA